MSKFRLPHKKARANQTSAQLQLTFETLEPRQLLTTFFVDGTNGNDLGPGTFDQPFATIQRGANFARPGDTVSIRGGTYREQVNLNRSGNTTAGPITFTAFNDEEVVVTATDRLTGFVQTAETSDDPNIYVASLAGSTTNSLLNRHELTVFVDGEVVQEARSGNSADYLDIDTWDTFNAASRTQIIDTSRSVPFNNDLVGSFVRIRTNNFVLETRRIAAASGNTLTLETPLNNDPGSGRYLLHDALSLVDSPGEWYFEEETNQFFLWAPGGGDPDNFTVEVKRRAEAFDTNANDHLHFRNLTLIGGDFDLQGSSNLVIDGVHIIAPDRAFGPDFGTTRVGLRFAGDDNVVLNSEFEQIWSVAIRLNGERNRIVNNFFHDTAFNGGGIGGVATGSGLVESLIGHNTFIRSGRGHIGQGNVGPRNVIEHNDFSSSNLLTEDGGAIYYNAANLGNLIIRYNSFHDIDNRFGSGIYTDNDVADVAIHNNIFYNLRDFGGKFNLPANFIQVFNNTYFNNGTIDSFFGGDTDDRISYGSRFYNNIFTSLDNDLQAGLHPFDVAGNLQSGSATNFVNPGSGDFRLTAGSAARNRGVVIPGINDDVADGLPDAGALEFGEPVFAIGHDFNSPLDPDKLVYRYEPVLFSNRVENTGFESGLLGFDTTGTPTPYSESDANYRVEGLARFGFGAALLNPGDGVSRTITNLRPNTTYTLSALAQIVGPVLQAEDALSSVPITTHRGLQVRGELQNGDEVRFNNIDFGTGSALYDQLQIGLARADSGTSIQVFLDNTTGSPLATLNSENTSNFELFNINPVDLPNLVGTHDLIFRFTGSGDLGFFDEIRLLDTGTAERATFGVRDFNGTTVLSQPAGAVDARGVRPKLEFRTGPTSTSANIFFEKAAGSQFDVYLDAVSVAESTFEQPIVISTNQTEFNYDVGTAFEPDVLVTGSVTPFQLLSTAATGDVRWTGAVGSFDAGPFSAVNLANQDYILGSGPATLSHVVDNGTWQVRVNTSSLFSAHDNVMVRAEGQVVASGIDRDAGQFSTTTFLVDVFDGELNLEFSDADAINPEWTLNRLSLTQTVEFPDPGDFNGDGLVDGTDLAQWEGDFDVNDDSDANGDGVTNGLDFLLWQRNFGSGIVSTQTLFSASLNNGSFETIDPSNAPLTNSTGRRASTSSAPFLVGGDSLAAGVWEITGNNSFHGVDSTSTGGGAQDGNIVLVANQGARSEALSGAIPVDINAGDEFNVSFFTMNNGSAGTHDFGLTLRFDGNPTNDLVLTSGTHASATDGGEDIWVQRTGLGFAPVNASSIQVIATLDNTTGGMPDQVFLDNITLDVTSTAALVSTVQVDPGEAVLVEEEEAVVIASPGLTSPSFLAGLATIPYRAEIQSSTAVDAGFHPVIEILNDTKVPLNATVTLDGQQNNLSEEITTFYFASSFHPPSLTTRISALTDPQAASNNIDIAIEELAEEGNLSFLNYDDFTQELG